MLSGFEELLSLQISFVLMIVCGYILARIRIITDAAIDHINEILINFIVPMNLIKAYMGSADPSVMKSEPLVFALAVAVQLLMMLLNKILYNRYPDKQRRVLEYMTISANSGSLGLAVAEGLFGEIGLIHSSIYTTPNRVFVWTVGITYFTNEKGRKMNLKKILLHPCVIAILLGLTIFIFQIPIPNFIEKTAGSFGACMAPLSMLVIGASLRNVNFLKLVDRDVLYYFFLRLCVFPAITLALCWYLPIDSIAKTVSVLLSAMPAPIFAVVFANKYHCDEVFCSKCVGFTTVMSILTLPLWSMLCSALFG